MKQQLHFSSNIQKKVHCPITILKMMGVTKQKIKPKA